MTRSTFRLESSTLSSGILVRNAPASAITLDLKRKKPTDIIEEYDSEKLHY